MAQWQARGSAAAMAAALVASLAGRPLAAAPAPHVLVSSAWSRPVAAGLPTGAAYMTLTDPGSAPDRLIGASTPVAARMELHRSSMAGGVMSMNAVPEGLEIPAHGRAELAPGGYHFMLVGLKHGLAVGSSYPATLSFAHAGRVKVQIMIRPTPPGASMKAPPMGGMTMR